MKLRYKLYVSLSIPTPGFPHFYYMLGANLGLVLYGEVSVMCSRNGMFVYLAGLCFSEYFTFFYFYVDPRTTDVLQC